MRKQQTKFEQLRESLFEVRKSIEEMAHENRVCTETDQEMRALFSQAYKDAFELEFSVLAEMKRTE